MFITLFTYSFLFCGIYLQVFLIITLLQHRDEIKAEHGPLCTEHPLVTIIVPVFNEQETVEKTVNSLLALNYPADKLHIMVIDDGSKDHTWQFIQKFAGHPQITLHQKENGGKYTALNYGITHSTSEFIGCLDADSFVDADALNYIIPYFKDERVMAVTPSLKIQNADNVLRLIQNAEYNMGIFIRKLVGILDAQYVTPGPFSIFRKSVFSHVGLYKHAHNTEDLEMALRMQKHHHKIVNAHKAVVYTVGPRTLYRLYKQRVRWTGGFIQNVIDYKHMLLNPKYGNLGMLILPAAMYTMIGTLFFLGYSLYRTALSWMRNYERWKTIGERLQWSDLWKNWNYEWVYYNLQGTFFVGILMVSLLVFSIWYGKRLAGVKDKTALDTIYFLMLYSLISPLWLITSVYNTIRSKDAAWR